MIVLSLMQDEEDLNEITSGLKSGLKSWLSFGTTMTGQKNKDKPKSESDSDEVEVGEPSRLKVLFRETVGTGSVDKVVEEGQGKDRGTKSGRAAQAMAQISQGDDKLSRKSEEQVSKVQ